MDDIETHVFPGTVHEVVLMVAGIHASEQSGVEVARWVRSMLAERATPTRLGAVILPEVFAVPGRRARAHERTVGAARWENDCNRFRNPFANRRFPPPGQPLSFLTDDLLKADDGSEPVGERTGEPIPLLPGIKRVVQVIEAVRPVRIVSIHGKKRRTRDHLRTSAAAGAIAMSDDDIRQWAGDAIKGVNFPGIFVDPRYSPDPGTGFFMEDRKFDLAADPAYPTVTEARVEKVVSSAWSVDGRADEALCLAMARAVRDPTLVVGNHLGAAPEVVHYAKEAGTRPGFSLGDWAPVACGGRSGAPVFTIEVDQNHQSWAFLDGVQCVDRNGMPAGAPERPSLELPPQQFDQARSIQLQDYAQAIINSCLT